MVEAEAKRDELETWENIGSARHVIRKFSAKGDLVEELITGGRRFHVSTRERHLNSEMAADSTLDPFSNGMFSPVRLLETTEDAAEIASNPNLMGEEEMATILRGRIDTFRKRLAKIDNPVVLNRLIQVATDNDAPVSKVEAIKGRLVEVQPPAYNESSPPEPGNPVSPR